MVRFRPPPRVHHGCGDLAHAAHRHCTSPSHAKSTYVSLLKSAWQVIEGIAGSGTGFARSASVLRVLKVLRVPRAIIDFAPHFLTQ